MKKYVFVRQDDLKDCGISCLLMIIKTYKGNSSKEYLRWITNTNYDGVTALNLIETAKKFNFDSFGFKSSIKKINMNDLPIIAHTMIDNKYKHFVVIYNINYKRRVLTLADPASKIYKISFDEFEKISTGNFIYLKPYKKILYLKNSSSLLITIKEFITKNKKIIFLSVTLCLLFSILTCFTSYCLKFIIDNYINISANKLLFISFIIAMFLVNFIKSIINYFKYLLLINFNNHLDLTVFKNVYEKIISLPYIYFKNRTTGEVMARINDLGVIKQIFSEFITSIFIDVLLIIVSLIFLIVIDFKLLFIILITIPIYFTIFLFTKNKIKQNINLLKNESESVNTYLIDTVTNIETIRNLNINSTFIDKFINIYCEYINKFNNYNKIILRNNFFYEIIDTIQLVIIVILGFYLIRNGQIEVTDLLVITSLGSIISSSMINIIDFLFNLINGMASLNRINELCDIFEEEKENKELILFPEIIEVRSLNYSYNMNQNCLSNISFKINSKEKVIITGKSGIGKSTLSKILTGYLDVLDNQVFINGKDINKISKKLLKEKITLVCQNESLFPLSIKENIIMGRDISSTLFDKVCNLMKVDEIINKNFLTYDYKLEEGGFNFSGGQKQRIVLARSILKESDIYIFDESLCNLDVSLEREILINLFEYLKDKIVIVISHRFNNEDLFDKKIIL